MNFLGDLFARLACFLGWHHEHDLNTKVNGAPIMKMPPNIHIEGTYCCRCMKLNITEMSIDGRKQDVKQAGLMRLK